MILLDASAVLAYLAEEPGSEVVQDALLSGKAVMSVVNQTEVLGKLCDWGLDWPAALATFNKLAVQLEPYAAPCAEEAARLRPLTRALGLSLGDRACLATARLRKLPVLTGDRPWLGIAKPLELEILSFRPTAH